jgi:antitoxin component YwqK of YwqJK toxin-antitoxin module
MKRLSPYIAAFIVSSCQTTIPPDQIMSQKFVHKYGFDVSVDEWDQRSQEGQEIAKLKNGVTITRTFENGNLHGPTTYTFPNSETVEKILIYDQGNLLKQTLQDSKGVPIQEEAYEFDDRVIYTFWNENGVPLSVEEYNVDLLVNGKYFSLEHELEAQVENGNGFRIKRERSGLLISRDQIEDGIMTGRTTYHPNGQIHTVSHYEDYQLHGKQSKFTSSGRPLMTLHWDRGVLDGMKTVYRNGVKTSEIPYVHGQKNGMETHYDDLGNLIAKITWRNDKKHGCSKSYTEEGQDSEWFFNGFLVTAEKFELLESREQMVADFMQTDSEEILGSQQQ